MLKIALFWLSHVAFCWCCLDKLRLSELAVLLNKHVFYGTTADNCIQSQMGWNAIVHLFAASAICKVSADSVANVWQTSLIIYNKKYKLKIL